MTSLVDMFVCESNIASLKGIERAGFSCIGTTEKADGSRFTD